MPNWCENNLFITHKDADKRKELLEIIKKDEGFLSVLLPCPEELKIEAGYFGDTDKGAEMAKLYEENKKKYGYSHWYDWQVGNWGTKWDICDIHEMDIGEDGIHISFNTAWSPPIEAYDRLTELGYEIDAQYYEGGCAFVGRYEGGEDQCFDIPATYKEVIEQIPEELDDIFCISEGMREMEEENELE